MILKIIYGLIILGIIVFIHESGHFLAALACSVKVEAFSIGMGPVLLHKSIRGIDWRISLLPLGGYCAMKGEKDFMQALENDENQIYGDSDSLYGVHPLKRAFIAFAGPLANIILAFLAFFIISLTGYTYWSASGQITLANELYPQMHSAAAEAGIKTDDVITMINGSKTEDFSDIYNFVALHPDEDLRITVMRGDQELEFTVHSDLDKSSGAGKIGVVSKPDTYVQREARRYVFFGAVVQAAKETAGMTAATVRGIATLFKGVKLTQAVSGPASITAMLGDTVKTGFSVNFRTGLSSVLNFVALISISLFIMNLLPIPVLDGGLILFSLIEAVFHVNISPKLRYRVQYIGLAFIAFLFIVAVIGDFNYFAGIINEK